MDPRLEAGWKNQKDHKPWFPSGFDGGCLSIPQQNGGKQEDDLLFFFGSQKMVKVLDMVYQIADADVTVLIQGESGVGKELVARAIQHESTRKDKPFIKINCAALPENLLESELFGYEKGAFTDAYARKPGKFELADKATILLDEISKISPPLQAKLLRVLQDGEFSRLGGNRDVKVDARVMASTNRNLGEYVKTGHFREDLYYRLNVVNIHVPPLRERREEIPILIEYFLQKYCKEYRKPVPTLSRKATEQLVRHQWPGNVRELENMAKRVAVLGYGRAVKGVLNSQNPTPSSPPVQLREDGSVTEEPKPATLKEIGRKAAREAETEVMKSTLNQTRWNRRKAAVLLGVSYRTLLYKIKEYELDLETE